MDGLRFGVGKERLLELGDEWIGVISSLIEQGLSLKRAFTSRYGRTRY